MIISLQQILINLKIYQRMRAQKLQLYNNNNKRISQKYNPSSFFHIQQLNIIIKFTMNENPLKNWLKQIQLTKIKKQAFGSTSERSLGKSSAFSNPGPGAYNPPLKDIQTTERYHIRKQKDSKYEKEFMWIYGSQRDGGMIIRQNNYKLGPGAYQVQKQSRIHLKNSWSKASRFKTQPHSIETQLPGPGYYNAHINTENTPSAKHVFNSKLQKSLFFSKQKEKRIFSSTEKLQDFQLQDPRYQSSLKSIKDSKKKQQKSSIFASKVPRFITDSGINDVGPGEYQIQDSNRSRTKSNLPQVIRFKPSKAPVFKKKSTTFVGPGAYNMNKYTISREVQFKGFPISRETRFNFSKKKIKRDALIPGPGSYMQNKYVFIDEKEMNSKKNIKKPKSTSQIHIFQQAQDDKKSKETQSRIYNIKCFDIQYRMRKQIQHQNRLKLMNISVPAFNSKAPRKI